jgi:hypothetical protein
MLPETQKHEKTCKRSQCQKTFWAERTDAHYCSPSCRALASRERRSKGPALVSNPPPRLREEELRAIVGAMFAQMLKVPEGLKVKPLMSQKFYRTRTGCQGFPMTSAYIRHWFASEDDALLYWQQNHLGLRYRGQVIREERYIYVPDGWVE